MATSIRLSRGGSKKRPYYRIVVADARAPRDGKFIERIGSYNPLLAKDNPERIKLDVERAKYWVGVGAQPTDRVARFLDANGVIERAARNNPAKAVPGQKAKDRAEDKAAKLVEAAEAKAAAEAAAIEAAAAAKAEAEAAAATAAESDATGSVKSDDTAEAVADAVADEVPADAPAADATAMAEQAAEGGPVVDADAGADAPKAEG